jgi:hypothetical protein
MSGIPPISSGSSSALSSALSSSLSTSNLSSVGASLLTTGSAPNPVPAAPNSTSSSGTISSYEAQYQNLQQYDTAELLYASFSLTPEQGLANFDSVLGQAASLLDAPAATSNSSSASTSTSNTSNTSSTSSSSAALPNLPSVASILAASDSEAQQTLTAYANAPVGSSIIDYQA